MAKKQIKSPITINDDNVINQVITETLTENYMPYAMSVIISRAIPEIDGFKPAHRKLLYTMYKMNLLKKDRIKSADVVGQTMRLNPHGDGAIYETLVRLTRGNGSLLHPFIDSKGNFGKAYSRDMAYAASRYTEVRLDNFCNLLFENIDKDTVDFVDNYNGTMQEPVLFPVMFPNILVTPNQGIAVGMASNICSFNLKEVCDATIAYIKNNNTDLTKTLLAPDLSTGGELIYDEAQIRKIYETGQGSFKVRAKYVFDSKNNCIEIYEIPYSTTAEAIIDKIVALVSTNKIKEINDIRDETDLNGLKITIDLKKNVDADKLMHRLYTLTPLLDTFNCNFNLLIDGKPRTLGVREIIEEWLFFRTACITREVKYDIDKKTAKLNMLEGLSKILLDIDKAIQIIRHTEEDKDVIPNLSSAFSVTNEQAEYIAEIKLRNLNKQYLLNRIQERDSLKAELEQLNLMLEDDGLIKKRITKELKDISKKYGTDRKTDIIENVAIPSFTDEHFIEDFPLTIFLTEHGYFKKIPHTSLRSASTQLLKEDDTIIQQLTTTNKNDIIFFTSNHNAYKAKLYDLSEHKASAMGDYLQNLLGLDDNEQVLYITATTDYSGLMLFSFVNGKVAKVPLESYATKVNRKKLINAFSDKSPIVSINYAPTDCNLLITRDTDKSAYINTSLIPIKTTKNSQGVQVFKLKKDSSITSSILVQDLPPITDEEPSEEYQEQLQQHEYYEKFRSNDIPTTGHFIGRK